MKFSIAFLIRKTCSKINRGSYKDARSQFSSLLFSFFFFLSLSSFFLSFFSKKFYSFVKMPCLSAKISFGTFSQTRTLIPLRYRHAFRLYFRSKKLRNQGGGELSRRDISWSLKKRDGKNVSTII